MFFTSRNKKLAETVALLQKLETNVIKLNKENINLLNSFERREKELLELVNEQLEILSERKKAIEKIISEKSMGFPWLADAIAEFFKYQDFELANYLEKKKHPAYKKAEDVREIAREKKLLKKQLKIAQNFVSYYETLFPWLTDYVGEDLDDLLDIVSHSEVQNIEDDIDPVLKYITKSEYDKLSDVEKNQKALDRYLASRKKSYEIGRDYERYIGYLYEIKGYKVEYIGIEKGLEDLGRDLICIKDNEIEIVQCKCWASHKMIHEKHINQLYGTSVKYYIEHQQITEQKKDLVLFPDIIKSGYIKATFVTSTKLSDTAKKFASALGINVIEEKPLEKYPIIKCNINSNGNKIYHLPFDQQYDRTIIKNNGEHYAMSVMEAESKGFRRAFRWKGS